MRGLIAACVLLVAASAWAAANVALLTDYGANDHYAAILSGAILRVAPETRLVTLSHEVPAFDVREGSYLLGQAAPEFPAATIFVCVVDPGVGTARRPVVIETMDGKLFVGPDNGVFTAVLERLGLRRAFEITNDALTRGGVRSTTFHGRDLFGPVAGHLAAGTPVEQVGPPVTDPVRLPTAPAKRAGGRVEGQVVHRDHYGNLLTNIPVALLEELGVAPGDTLTVRAGGRTLRVPFRRTYGDVPAGAVVLVVNSEGHAELARNRASAGEALGARAGAAVSIGKR